MSRYHYYIESKSRMKITAEKGPKKDIFIKDVITMQENKRTLMSNGSIQNKMTAANKPTKVTIIWSAIVLFVYFSSLVMGILYKDSTAALIASCVSFTTAITMGPMLTHFMNFANIKIGVWLVSATFGIIISVLIVKFNPEQINPLLSIENIGNVLTVMSIGFVLIPDVFQDIMSNF